MTAAAPAARSLTVYIVDDDSDVRDALGLLLGLRGYRTMLYESAEAFLRDLTPDLSGCLITDIRMPGMSGLELQQELGERCHTLPVVVLTAHGNVTSARAALRAQAVDFLSKPCKQEELVAAIEVGFERERARLALLDARALDEERLASLTPREREVAALLATGAQNRDIARQLDISPRTVEIHKARCLEKLQVRTLADLVRLADRVGLNAAR
jgi:FixJ family two-component response regulator